MKFLSRRTLIPIFAAVAVGTGGVLWNLNDSEPDNQTTNIPVQNAPIEQPLEEPTEVKLDLSSFDIIQNYIMESRHNKHTLIFNPDGENGIFEVDDVTGRPVTNRNNLYNQSLDLADQLIADGVTNPEEIFGIMEAQLRGGNAFLEPHSVSPYGSEDHQHYAYVTPFPRAYSSHAIEQRVGWMTDPTIMLISPYSSLSHEVFVGFHEQAHALEFLEYLRESKHKIGEQRQRLLAEATADCYAMLLYERAGIDYPDALEGLDGALMDRVAHVRTIAILQSVVQTGATGNVNTYLNHPFTDSFVDIVRQVKEDGVLEAMTLEEMALMARDHVIAVSQQKITEDYVDELGQALQQDADALRGLPFKEQASQIRKWLENGRFDGIAREYYTRYLEAVDGLYNDQNLDQEQAFEAWDAKLRQTYEQEVDLEKAWSIEGELLRNQLQHLFRTVMWVRDHEGHEAARTLYDRMMNGDPEISDIVFAERLKAWTEMGQEFGFEIDLAKHIEPPAVVVRMNASDIIRTQADLILGDQRGRVAIIDYTDTLSVDDAGQFTFDIGQISPTVLQEIKDQMREDRTDQVPAIINTLKAIAGNNLGADTATNPYLLYGIATTGEHKYAILAPVPEEMSAHQIEQRITRTYDPDITWTTDISADSWRSFLSFRDMFALRLSLDPDAFERLDESMLETPAGRMAYNAQLDLMALLAFRQAEVNNPRSFGSTAQDMGQRLAQIRDFSVLQSLIAVGNTVHALDFDTSRFVLPYTAVLQYGLSDEKLREMSFEDMAKHAQDFFQSEGQRFSPADFNALGQDLTTFYNTDIEGQKFSDLNFFEQRDLLNTTATDYVNATNPNSDLADLVRRVTEASWEVAEPAPRHEFLPVWKQAIMPMSDFSKDEALIRVEIEKLWLMEQAARSGVNLPREGVTPSDNTPVSIEERLQLLEQYKQQLMTADIYYSPDEAAEILRTHLNVVTINVEGRTVQVQVTPDMIAANGSELTVPHGHIPGVQGPVRVIIPPEYVAMLDPNAEERLAQQQAGEEQNYILNLPLPNGQTINIVVTKDMVSEDGRFVTLPDGVLPPHYENPDGKTKIFVAPGSLVTEEDAAQESFENEEGAPEAQPSQSEEVPMIIRQNQNRMRPG